MTQETITFNIANTTNGIVPVSILGNPQNPMDNANATTRYAWNVTSLTFGTLNSITLQYKGVSQTTFSVAQTTFITQSYQGICDALNTLNLGSFFVTTSGGNTFINNYNQNFVFGQLDIYNASLSEMSFNNLTTFNALFSTINLTLYTPPALPVVILVISGDNSVYSLSTNGTPPLPSFDITTNTIGTANSYLEVIKNGVVVYGVFGTNFNFPFTTLTPPDQYVINWYDVAP
jgi:hypothetical protein